MKELIESIKKYFKGTIHVAGSVRRESKTPKDLDLVVESFESLDSSIFEDFTPIRIILQEKSTGKLCELFFSRNPNTFGCFLMYFTGCLEFINFIRMVATKKGLVYSAYGLMDRITKEIIDTPTEEDVFKVLELPYYSPTDRQKFKQSTHITNDGTDTRFIENQYN